MSSHCEEGEPFAAAGTSPEPVAAVAELPLLDVSTIVEEAEQFLRESAPHDFDVLVIGGGAGGSAAALRAAQLGARVGLIEQDVLGGSHLIGARLALLALRAEPNLTRTHRAVAEIDKMFAKSLENAGVRTLRGQARFIGEHTIEIADKDKIWTVKAVHVVIAVGTLPRCAPNPGPAGVCPLSLEELLLAPSKPDCVIVKGRIFEALAAASLCRLLGIQASLDIVAEVNDGYDEELLDAVKLQYDHDASAKRPTSGLIEVDLARKPATSELGMEEIGIAVRDGCPIIDEFFETNVGGVYAIGSCVRGESLTQLSVAEGNVVAERILRRGVPNLGKVPYYYGTEPPVAFVGMSERAAKKNGISVRTGMAYFENNPASTLSGDTTGWVKMVVDAETDRLLGCQIVGGDAREIAHVVTIVLNQSQNLEEFAATVMSYPSCVETARQAALATRGQNWGQALP